MVTNIDVCKYISVYKIEGGILSNMICMYTYVCASYLVAMYSEATACMRQLMCAAMSQLISDQLIPLHHYAHLLYPACL
jgi:hypothetical protein